MRNILRNNRGFTLLEILVTVGIVGVLSAVAVPAYNQYKRGTVETAIESDIGNFQKAYMAFNAVNGSYCSSFTDAGIAVRDGRNYAKNGAIGFNSINIACGGNPANVSDVEYKPADLGTCTGTAQTVTTGTAPPACSTHATRAPCDGAAGCTWNSATQGTITACELDVDQFRMGATTNVSGIEKIWGINEEGKIGEDSGSGVVGAADCGNAQVSANW